MEPYYSDAEQKSSKKTLTELATQALADRGFNNVTPKIDAGINRFQIGDKKNLNGWYAFYSDGVPAGVFGNWVNGEKFKWCAKAETELTTQERIEYQSKLETIRVERERQQAIEYQAAAIKAQEIWDASADAVDHVYLKKKQVEAIGLKNGKDGRLIIPVYNADEKLQSLQYIFPNSDKRSLTGGKMSGGWYCIDGDPGRVAIAEGYATAATVHQASGFTVYVAFTAGNLLTVAKIVKTRHPGAYIVVCCDNDQWKDKNPGLTKGREAAEAIGASVIVPIFKNTDTKPTDFNDLLVLEGVQEVKRQVEARQIDTNKSTFKLIHVGELIVKSISWLIENFIETDSLGLLFGDPGTFKSFLAIAFACCVASGKEFFGHKVKQGTVIFIAGEGMNGLARRFMAWSIRNQVALKDMPLFISAAPTGLCDPERVQFVLDAVADIAAKHGEPLLVVIDTVSRNYGPGDENSTKDMVGFISGCDRVRTQYGATVLLVHHCGLMDKTRSRGSMALKGALDAEYRLDRDESGVIRFEATKMKDADYPPPTAFRPAVVELGIFDEGGKQSTSIVLDETNYEPPAAPGKAGRGKWQAVAIEVLGKLQDAAEQRLTSRGFDPDTARVSVEEWRCACSDAGIKDRRIWKKINDSLVKIEKVEIENGFVVIL